MSKSTSTILLYGRVRPLITVRLHMRLYFVTFTYLFFLPILAFSEPSSFNRYTVELPKLLETDAATVMTKGMTYDFAKKLCARLGGPIAQEFETEATEWRKRNDPFISGATKALNEFGDRYLPVGGEQAKQEYFQKLLHFTAKIANDRVMRQLNGANLDNNISPLEAECSSLARTLHDGVADFDKTPEITQALVPYMQRKSQP